MTRTVHFPPARNGHSHEDNAITRLPDTPSFAPEPRKTNFQAPGGTLDANVPAIVIWGRMMQTARHVNEQLKHLPNAIDDYHGTLRVLVTAAQSLETDAKRLLLMLGGAGSGIT